MLPNQIVLSPCIEREDLYFYVLENILKIWKDILFDYILFMFCNLFMLAQSDFKLDEYLPANIILL